MCCSRITNQGQGGTIIGVLNSGYGHLRKSQRRRHTNQSAMKTL